MKCKVCETSVSNRWRGDECNSCYLKRWRQNNITSIAKYDESLERRFVKAKRRANNRKIEWSISLEEYASFAFQECFYCQNKLGDKVAVSTGLDRIDNSKGYISGNIVSCCNMCNTIKNDFLSSEEMKQVAQLIISLRK